MNFYFLYSSNELQILFSKVNFFKQSSLEDSFFSIIEDKCFLDREFSTKNNSIIFTNNNGDLHITKSIIIKNEERMMKIIDYFTFFFSLKKCFKLNLILLKLGFKPGNKSFNYILYFGYQYCNGKINNNTKIKNIYIEISLFFGVTKDSVAKAINRDFININLETDYKNIDLSKKENRVYNFVILNKSVKVFLFSLVNYYLSIEDEEFL